VATFMTPTVRARVIAPIVRPYGERHKCGPYWEILILSKS
jgi:hypothetical protein